MRKTIYSYSMILKGRNHAHTRTDTDTDTHTHTNTSGRDKVTYALNELAKTSVSIWRRQRELIRELHMYIPGSHPPLPPQPLLSPPKPFASTSLTLDEEKLSEFLCVLAASH